MSNDNNHVAYLYHQGRLFMIRDDLLNGVEWKIKSVLVLMRASDGCGTGTQIKFLATSTLEENNGSDHATCAVRTLFLHMEHGAPSRAKRRCKNSEKTNGTERNKKNGLPHGDKTRKT